MNLRGVKEDHVGSRASKGVKGNEGGQVVRISLRVNVGGRERG